MGGGGVRSEETGQPARRTRGTKGDAIMRGASRWKAVERGEATRQPSGREAWEGRDEWPESSVDTANGSLMVRYNETAPQWQWTAQLLLDGKIRCDGSSTARDGASAVVMDREHNGDGQRWTARWRIEGEGGCNGEGWCDRDGNLTARDGTMVTRRRWTTRNGASAMAMLMSTRPAGGAIKVNVALNYKM